MTESTLDRARAGDNDAFRELTDPYRRELQLHCYRLLGSVQDSEDLLQETLLAAWRSLDGFEQRSSMRAWLYRIATNRCLNLLRDRSRRPRELPPMADPPEPSFNFEPTWLEPYPDQLLEGLPDHGPGPDAVYTTRESVGLAFMRTIQALPPRQRVVLVLRDVLGFRTSEVAEMLESGAGSVKGALQRARAAIGGQPGPERDLLPAPDSPRQRELAGRFADAVERGDIDRIVTLLTDEALLTMPPQPFAYQGRETIASFLRDRMVRRGGPLRVIETRANGQPAFGAYFPDAEGIPRRYGMLAITVSSEAITSITFFGDPALLERFGLPETVPAA